MIVTIHLTEIQEVPAILKEGDLFVCWFPYVLGLLFRQDQF